MPSIFIYLLLLPTFFSLFASRLRHLPSVYSTRQKQANKKNIFTTTGITNRTVQDMVPGIKENEYFLLCISHKFKKRTTNKG